MGYLVTLTCGDGLYATNWASYKCTLPAQEGAAVDKALNAGFFQYRLYVEVITTDGDWNMYECAEPTFGCSP